MRRFGPNIQFAPEPERPPLKTEIFWGCDSGGITYFPKDLAAIHSRRHSQDPKPMDAFSKTVSGALERVWIVDEYFLLPDKGRPDDRILTILDWFPLQLVASDIRILTKNHEEISEDMLELFKQKEKDINVHQARRAQNCSIQINTRLTERFDYVHDRFAIIDDELWHFGATVGGFHASVNAASRGWSATDSGAIEFFELAWNRCNDK